MNDLFQGLVTESGPVECLGQTFPNDAARREHYLKLLAEKLKDPEFRKIEGFSIGTDEAILELSDPPYYTACPNPFLGEFIQCYAKPYDSLDLYNKEPFAADVSEGKNDQVYLAHSYHTKVPHKAIMRYILHYTQPGDVVFDAFCGTGMTGIAAQLCGDRSEVESLGYRVGKDGTIFSPEQEDGKAIWREFSRLGARKTVLNDLSPAATFIAQNYNAKVDVSVFEQEAKNALMAVEDECAWMFQTLHHPNDKQLQAALSGLAAGDRVVAPVDCAVGRINYTVWSDVFLCKECSGEIVFWDVAVDRVTGKVADSFNCPRCNSDVTKRSLDRVMETKFDRDLNELVRQAKQVPVFISYRVGTSKFDKAPDKFDIEVIKRADDLMARFWVPVDRIPDGDEARRNDEAGITHSHHFFSRRNLLGLAAFRELHPNLYRAANLTSTALVASKLYRFRSQNGSLGAGGGPMSGTLYIPSLIKEIPILKLLKEHIDKTVRVKQSFKWERSVIVTTGSATFTQMPDNSLDYLFVDPPFGSNIQYSDLNCLWESWLKVYTATRLEAIESKTQNKSINQYRQLMSSSFREAYRVLKPGRWMTVEFSNTQAVVWNSIQTALQEAGFVVANVSALDKKQGSFKAVTTTTAVKQDLVISAYKPNGGLEGRFATMGGGEDSVWDFVRTHLNYLPVLKFKSGELEFVAERDPRIIFDRMVAWFFRHNVPVPMSTQEFQKGLAQRFAERDGMVFLPGQVAEYDKKRMQIAAAPQMEMFVSDERSAIDWLTDALKRRPSTYQEINSDFMSQLGAGWKKHEARPELAALLEDNFIQYDGKSEVSSQIHSYLSTNFKDLRGLEKDDPRLVAKATGRWYVPDPNKAQDLEKKREKALLKEFETYRGFTGRKLKEFRLEALRVGFRNAWTNKDYQSIIAIAAKLPDAALQEDEKLLTLYDMALTRTEDAL
ncbi:DNA methyltransferase [Pseudomonas sp. PDM31]|uniref:DNA methyltransferase n=1 Tax=Pseudomonas sp. PDM31 TaxID=2854778 RepID=UPI001C455B39|nr:DNA methyltransferase [Pseudomonas sp. PDM31]MBV7478147.1 DNA methylase [Pseudomonas sp. PDM31]